MNDKRSELPVLVAGGGIGGLSAALALVRQGFSVKMLEQAPQISEIGAGIQLGPMPLPLSTRWVLAKKPVAGRAIPTRG